MHEHLQVHVFGRLLKCYKSFKNAHSEESSAFVVVVKEKAICPIAIQSVCWPQPCITKYTKLRRESFLFHRDAIEHHPEGFSPRVLELLQSGNVSEREYLEAKSWQNAHTLEIDTLLTRRDVLVLPTTPTAAPRRATNHIELVSGEVSLRDALVLLTLPFSMAGVPTISLPLLSAEGLPVGLQLVARRGHDSTLMPCSMQLLKEAL